MKGELLPHGPRGRGSDARCHTAPLALTLALSGFFPPESHPSPASAPELGGCHRGCMGPLRVGRIRGPAQSSPCTSPCPCLRRACPRAGQGTGCAAPRPRSRTAVLGPCHPTHRAAVPSPVLPAGRGGEGRGGWGLGSIFLAGEAGGAGPGAVAVPGTCSGLTWGAAARPCVGSLARSPDATCGTESQLPWSGRGRDRDGSQVPTTGHRPPRHVPCAASRWARWTCGLPGRIRPQATPRYVCRRGGSVCLVTCPRPQAGEGCARLKPETRAHSMAELTRVPGTIVTLHVAGVDALSPKTQTRVAGGSRDSDSA